MPKTFLLTYLKSITEYLDLIFEKYKLPLSIESIKTIELYTVCISIIVDIIILFLFF